MTIGERIRYLRIQKNMKIQELASAANVTRQTVSRYETGAIDTIPEQKLMKIAEVLGVSLAYLQGCTIESMISSAKYDIKEQHKLLTAAETEEEKQEIRNAIEALEESYRDLLWMNTQKFVPCRLKTVGDLSEDNAGLDSEDNTDLDSTVTVTIKMSSNLYWMMKKVAESTGTTTEKEIEKSVKMRLKEIIKDDLACE